MKLGRTARTLSEVLGFSVFVLGLIILGVFWFAGRGLCSNTVVMERASPSGRYRAVVFDRDCGATTAISTQISVLRSGTSLDSDMYGNCVVFQKEGSGIALEWRSDAELTIDLGYEPMRKRENCGGIRVTYRIHP